MPVVLDRLPLPNLTWYTGFSFLLLVFSVYYAGMQVSNNPNWKDKFIGPALTYEDQIKFNKDNAFLLPFQMDLSKMMPGVKEKVYPKKSKIKVLSSKNDLREFIKKLPRTLESSFTDDEDWFIDDNQTFLFLNSKINKITPYIIPEVLTFMLHEPLCIWTLINMAYCFLILLGTTIQHLVFGELRVSEQQHIKDKFWNFVFYKFVFVFGVMNVQAMGEGILWCSWFSILGFLHLLAQLCKDRFEYLSFSPTTPQRTHFRLLGLLSLIFLLSTLCLFISVFVGFHAGISTFAFMLAEGILLMIRTLYVITRYIIYLWDISHDGLWEKRGHCIYWTELMFELSELTIDMIHHIHMLLWANMLLTMASLVIFMQLRMLFYQLQHKIKSHRSYLKVVRLIQRYAKVHGRERDVDEDTCAICWEPVEVGRLLDCNHIFHSSCLLAWLHHDLSCPTCRHKLNHHEEDRPSSPGLLANLLPTGIEGDDSGDGDSVINSRTEALNGWRYVSWLPSFSVEQSHTQLPRHHQVQHAGVPTSQLDSLARQVHQMFPDISYENILEDLRHTKSIEDTIDNILENRMVAPPPMFSQNSRSENNFKESENHEKNSLDNQSSPLTGNSISVFSLEEKSKDLSSSETESDSDDTNCTPGSYFSKSPGEREKVLSQRKEFLLSRARQRFISLQSMSNDSQ